MSDTKKYHALLLSNPLLDDSPAIELSIDAADFNSANWLAEKMASSIGYAIEQVREL